MAMDTKHTPGPVRWEKLRGNCVSLEVDGSREPGRKARILIHNADWPMTEADIRRIQALWNACLDIPTEALELGVVRELYEALEAWERWLKLNPKGNDPKERSDAFQWAKRLTRLALIKLRHPDAKLAREQACGCVVCICDHETQCQGCGAKHCGTHPAGEIPYPLFDGIEDGASFTDVFRERARRGEA